MEKGNHPYIIPDIIPANEFLLMNDVYLIVLHASRVPPHLALSVNGKLYTLTVKGATVNGELISLLKLIRQRSIESIFIKLCVPELFTLQQLKNEIEKYTLAYPRVDVGVATCLNPIKDFCSSIYDTEISKVNFLYDLLPKLYEQKVITSCYHLNLDRHLTDDSFFMRRYSMNDIYESIRKINVEI